MAISVRKWFNDVLTKLSTCPACLHDEFDDGCPCEAEDCVCFQERKVTHIDCLACGYVPETDEPGIYAQFGQEALQFRETWQAHVDALHGKTMGESCATPQWRVSYTVS